MEYTVFTYGTLMKDQFNHHYVENSEYLCDAVLADYGLLETAYAYPAAVPMKDFKVYGEVYRVDEKTKEAMDELEDVGILYDCVEKEVETDQGKMKVLFYEFIDDGVKRPLRLPYGKWSTIRKDLDDYVWYAVYGSNLLKARFDLYLDKTIGKERPLAEAPFTFDHPLYFANEMRKWDFKGVAYLDLNRNGKSYGWRYLVSRQQFESIKENEGPSYDSDAQVGTDELGIPIRTITASQRYPKNGPSRKYLEVIAAGLIEKELVKDLEEAKAYLGTNEELDISQQHIASIIATVR